tara:strand:- start:150 stop:1250 length:1101 start_codon:yes stop_codon:yes gene_type:complete
MDIYYLKYLKYKKKYLDLKSNENYYGGKKPASKKPPARCLKDNQKVSNKLFHKITKEEIAAAYVACEITEATPTALKSKMKSIKVSDNDAIKYLLREYVGPLRQKYTPQKLEKAGYKASLEDLKKLGFTISELRYYYQPISFKRAGYDPNEIVKAFYVKGSNNSALKSAGFGITKRTDLKDFKMMDKNYPKSFVVPFYVTEIGDEAFKGKSIESITIHDGVTSIGDEAFMNTDIKSIIIPGSIKKIGVRAFANTKNLKEVTISNGVEEIGDEAFTGANISKLVIPDSVIRVGRAAFKRSGVSRLTLPRKEDIRYEDEAFYDNRWLSGYSNSVEMPVRPITPYYASDIFNGGTYVSGEDGKKLCCWN